MYAVNYESSKILKFYNLAFVELTYQTMNAVICESSKILKFYNLAFIELIYKTMYTVNCESSKFALDIRRCISL